VSVTGSLVCFTNHEELLVGIAALLFACPDSSGSCCGEGRYYALTCPRDAEMGRRYGRKTEGGWSYSFLWLFGFLSERGLPDKHKYLCTYATRRSLCNVVLLPTRSSVHRPRHHTLAGLLNRALPCHVRPSILVSSDAQFGSLTWSVRSRNGCLKSSRQREKYEVSPSSPTRELEIRCY
jgi:hypothetical protein